jgi:hypothetical protein
MNADITDLRTLMNADYLSVQSALPAIVASMFHKKKVSAENGSVTEIFLKLIGITNGGQYREKGKCIHFHLTFLVFSHKHIIGICMVVCIIKPN